MDIVDEATAAEARFFSHHGETNETIIALDELKSVAEEAASRFSQLSSLQLHLAESQSSRVFIKLLTSLSFKKAAVILSIPFSEALEREIRYAIAFFSPHGCIVTNGAS